MKKVIITVDYNPNSEKVVNKGYELAKMMNAEVCLLHVLSEMRYYGIEYQPFMGYEGYAFPVDYNIQEEFVKVAEDYLQQAKRHIGGENVSTKLVEGDTANEILKYSNECGADLIVMGTNGVTGAKEVVFGSNTINVIRKVDCATLVIPKGFQYKKPHTLFLPLDQTDSLNSKAFLKLLSYVKTFKTSLDVVRVIPQDEGTPEAQDQEHLKTNLKNTTFDYQLVKNKNIHEVVAQYLNKNKADLMALLVQKETAFERFLTASDTKKISDDLKVPLFIFHSH